MGGERKGATGREGECQQGLNLSSRSWTGASTHGSRRQGQVSCPHLLWKRKSWSFWLAVRPRCVQCSRLVPWPLPCPCLSPTLIVLADCSETPRSREGYAELRVSDPGICSHSLCHGHFGVPPGYTETTTNIGVRQLRVCTTLCGDRPPASAETLENPSRPRGAAGEGCGGGSQTSLGPCVWRGH